MSLKSKVESLISAGNETTGQSKTDLTSVVQDLVDGYGQGGGDITVEPLSVTANGTYTAPSGKAYTPISVNVPMPVVLVRLSAVYTPSRTVYDVDNIEDLKSDLVVTALYSDSSTEVIPSTDYILDGTLEAGIRTISVVYGDNTATFQVDVIGVTYLFKDGNECTALTGGYQKKGMGSSTTRMMYENTGDFLSFKHTTSGSTAGTLSTINAVDLSDYKSICIDADSMRTKTDGSYFRAYVCETVTNGTNYGNSFGEPSIYQALYNSTTNPMERTTFEKVLGDEITVTPKYIAISFNNYNNASAGAYLRVYNIYLKPKDSISDADALNILLGGETE